jgi:hypothetical protein
MRQVVRMTFMVTAAVLASAALSPLSAQPAGQQGKAATRHACSLLSVTEIRDITGRPDMPAHSYGDEPGEGAGGGSSCNYGGETLTSLSAHPPRVGIVLIPGAAGERFIDRRRKSLGQGGCKVEPVAGVGDEAFFECQGPKGQEIRLDVKAGAYDLLILMEVVPSATVASVRPTVLALAKAAVAKLR